MMRNRSAFMIFAADLFTKRWRDLLSAFQEASALTPRGSSCCHGLNPLREALGATGCRTSYPLSTNFFNNYMELSGIEPLTS